MTRRVSAVWDYPAKDSQPKHPQKDLFPYSLQLRGILLLRFSEISRSKEPSNAAGTEKSIPGWAFTSPAFYFISFFVKEKNENSGYVICKGHVLIIASQIKPTVTLTGLVYFLHY